MAGNYLHMWLLLAIVFEAVAVSSGARQTGCEVDVGNTARACALHGVRSSGFSPDIKWTKYFGAKGDVFFSSPVASVVLLEVNNYIFNPNTIIFIDVPCFGSEDSSTDSINTTTTAKYEFSWTSSVVYTIIDPLIGASLSKPHLVESTAALSVCF